MESDESKIGSSKELPDKTAIFDATGYRNFVDGNGGADDNIEFLDPALVEEIIDSFDDNSAPFTSDGGIMGNQVGEVEKKKIIPPIPPIHRFPTMKLEAIDRGSVNIRQLHHIDNIRREHAIIDPRRGYVLGEDASDFCVIPGEKPIYDGKDYAKAFIELIKPQVHLDRIPFSENARKRIHYIADRIHNIPYVALRVYNNIQVDGGYRLEFTALRKGKGYLKGKTRLDDFIHLMNKSVEENSFIEFNEIEYADSAIVQEALEHREEFNRVLNMVLKYELLSDYSDFLRKIHQDADFAVSAEIHIDEKKLRISGVDHSQEALFELKFSFSEGKDKEILEQLDKFIRLLTFYFQQG